MKTFVLAPVIAALAMFAFGAVFWMSPLPYKALTPVADNTAAGAALAQIFPSTGTYVIPGPEITDPDLRTKLNQRGPLVQVQFIKEGHNSMEAGVFIKGYLHYLAVALLLSLLIRNSGVLAKQCYWCVVKLTTMTGVIGAILICLSDPIWWHHPWGWHLMFALYAILTCAIAGLVLGKFFQTARSNP